MREKAILSVCANSTASVQVIDCELLTIGTQILFKQNLY